MNSVVVYYDSQRFAGWPSNAGMWSWGNEVLVAFHLGTYLQKKAGHCIDSRKEIITALARSLDGGKSWRLELDNMLNELSHIEPIQLPSTGIEFTHPSFALKIGNASVEISNSTFYTTYDKGHTWQGPYLLPYGNKDMTARTDYVVEGRNSCTMILSKKMTGIPCKSHPDRAYAMQTNNGGLSWEFLGYLADKNARSALTNTVRLSDGVLVSTISRRCNMTEDGELPSQYRGKHSNHWIEVRRSVDGGKHWQRLSIIDTPYGKKSRSSNPSCLGHLPDGRLVIHYAFRGERPRFVARLSDNGGKSWGQEIVLDHDVNTEDIGYPKMAMLPFGNVLVVYHTASSDRPQSHIKCITWHP